MTQDPQLTVLSLGAGVQSTALLMLVLEGEVTADCAIFADTGWEPPVVYRHLEALKRRCAGRLPLYVVSAGNIRDTSAPDNRRPRVECEWATMPYHIGTAASGEARGMTRRQCTVRLKIAPVRRKIRQLMLERGIKPHPGAVVQLLGISADEITRMKPANVHYIRHEWPLIERGWSRADCKAFLASRGIDAPRSACIGCPYHSDEEWRALRDNDPESFADAVVFEREVQARFVTLHAHGYLPFLHKSRVPLDRAPLDGSTDQLSLDDWQGECEGMCGV